MYRSLAVVCLVCACGRFGFDPLAGPNAEDGSIGSADAPPDSPDGAVSQACGSADTETLALFSFEEEGATHDDETGAHTASVVGGSGRTVPGPSGCGMALEFLAGVHAEVPDSPQWDLNEGSIDLWVRFAEDEVGYFGILSRDAQGSSEPGHLALYRLDTGTILVRMQASDSEALCSDAPVEFDRWTHIGINFGPPRAELYVDGALGTRTDVVDFFPPGGVSQPMPCNQPTTTGTIANNSEPWVIGAGNILSDVASATPVMNPLTGGAVDSVRISRARRAFGP